MRLMKTRTQGVTEIDRVSFSDQGVRPVSTEQVKLWMRREGVDDENFQIDDLITDAVDAFMRITNRSLVSQTITAVFTSYGKSIRLPYGPVSSIESVKLLDMDTEEVTTDYYLQGDTITFNKLQNTGLEIVYKSDGDFPDGLLTALMQCILTNYNDREDNVLGGVTQVPNNSRKKALRYKRY